MSFDHRTLGQDLINEGRSSRWLSCFLLSYQLPEVDMKDCELLVEDLLEKANFECYPVDDWIHFLYNGTRVHITQSNYFSFRSVCAEVREVKTEAERLVLEQTLKLLQRQIQIKPVVHQARNIWTVDPLEFKFTKQDEQVLQNHIANFNTRLDVYRTTPERKGDTVSVVPQATRQKRPRVVLVSSQTNRK